MDSGDTLCRSLARLRDLVRSVPDDDVRLPLEAALYALGAHVAAFVKDHRVLVTKTAHLTRLSRCDEATGLFNQRYFMERLYHEFRRALRYGNSLSLCLADLDDFKLVNDAQGHLGGDEALKRVARTIRQVVRETDIAARYGGDEFAILLPHTDQGQALRLAERLRSAVNACPGIPSVSIGVASMVIGMGGPIELLTEADHALYKAKALGKNRVMKGTEPVWSIGTSSAV